MFRVAAAFLPSPARRFQVTPSGNWAHRAFSASQLKQKMLKCSGAHGGIVNDKA
jgi:hypothetical protein